MSDFAQMEQRFDPKQGGLVEFGNDSRLFVEFYARPVIDPVESTKEGRPVHVQVDYIRIQQPGERDRIDRPAHNGDRARFRNHYAAYQEGRQNIPDGTQLSVLFPNNPEIVENLKVDKIFTVEQLAGLTDTQIQNIGMGARAWQQKAAEFLMVAFEGKGMHAVTKQLEQLTSQIAALTDKNTALEAALEEATKKNRGKAA
jgi:hypothetical protein